MRPTRPSSLLLAIALAAVAAYVVVRAAYGSLPLLPRFAPLTLALVAVAEGYTGSTIRARIAGRPRTRPVLPLVVARTAALAKASSLAGAVVAGVYGGLLAYTLPRRGDLAAAGSDSVTSALGVVAALCLTAAALFLERSCRTPELPGPPGDGVGFPTPGPGGE